MAIELDEAPIARADHVIGQDLSALSVDELNARIALLRQEIARLEAEAAKKSAYRDAAASVFRL